MAAYVTRAELFFAGFVRNDYKILVSINNALKVVSFVVVLVIMIPLGLHINRRLTDFINKRMMKLSANDVVIVVRNDQIVKNLSVIRILSLTNIAVDVVCLLLSFIAYYPNSTKSLIVK